MKLGVSTVDITPIIPIYLAGFAHRKNKVTEVNKRLYLKTFFLEQQDQITLFFIADLIWWDNQFVKELKTEIADIFQMDESAICFHATHNHSGPQTSNRFSTELGLLNDSYVELLREHVLKGLNMAVKEKEKVCIEINKGKSKIGIYRRKKINDTIEMAPNPDVPIDDLLTVISFKTANNKQKAIWIHLACHPTTTDANVISSEYTGVCCERIEEYYKDSTVAFLQGFAGDIRPALVKDNLFYRGTLSDMENIGLQLAKEILQTMKKKETIARQSSFVHRSLTIPVDFSGKDIEEFVPKALSNEWPELVRENIKRGFNLTVQYIKINNQLSFITCNAELVQAYGQFLKKCDAGILPLGYSNGMVCYVPTAKQLEAGGYESLASIYYFGLPGQLSLEVERKIKSTFLKLIGGF